MRKAGPVLIALFLLATATACGGSGTDVSGNDQAEAGGSGGTNGGGAGRGGGGWLGGSGGQGVGATGGTTAGSGGAAGMAAKAGSAGTGGASGAAGTMGGSGGPSGSAGAAGSGTGGTSASAGKGGSSGCTPGFITCNGMTAVSCDASGNPTMMDCMTGCTPGKGCTACTPGTGMCSGDMAISCKSDGSGTVTQMCDPDMGLTCMNGACEGACSLQALGTSYIGCEYFPTVTSNGGLNTSFHFAVAVGNTSSMPANFKIYRGTTMVENGTVAPGQIQTVILPWVMELRHDYTAAQSPQDIDAALSSSLVVQGAYHLKSDQPVTVYQFNPLEYQMAQSATCVDPPGSPSDGNCHSFTNDASLLFPANALGSEYIVASRPTLSVTPPGFGSVNYPGVTAIVGVEDDTTVTVKSTAYVRPGVGVNQMNPGDTQTFKVNAGDVVQLLTADVPQASLSNCIAYQGFGAELCSVPPTYDLTGTNITSDKPIQVLGGHDCDFIPYDKYACDHLEETMFPLNTWGSTVIVTPPQSVIGAAANDGNPDQFLVRVISGADNNQITLDPLPPGASGGTLNKGQYADVPMTNLDFVVKATGPVLVAQFDLGGDIVDPSDSGTLNSKGDPDISLAIPQEQYRDAYVFLAPETYEYSFVNLIAPMGVTVMLDGQPVTSPPQKPIGSSGYGVQRKAIAGGPHQAAATLPFGIVVYGYGAYTSYMYPGGLNLMQKN